jgi:hypothetical protein
MITKKQLKEFDNFIRNYIIDMEDLNKFSIYSDKFKEIFGEEMLK